MDSRMMSAAAQVWPSARFSRDGGAASVLENQGEDVWSSRVDVVELKNIWSASVMSGRQRF